jgi:hypothetical protein
MFSNINKCKRLNSNGLLVTIIFEHYKLYMEAQSSHLHPVCSLQPWLACWSLNLHGCPCPSECLACAQAKVPGHLCPGINARALSSWCWCSCIVLLLLYWGSADPDLTPGRPGCSHTLLGFIGPASGVGLLQAAPSAFSTGFIGLLKQAGPGGGKYAG